MSKVKFKDWRKIVTANKADSVVVEFPINDNEVVAIEVKPRISLSDRIMLVNTVVDSCCPLPFDYEPDDNTPDGTVDAHRRPALEYMEPVFRATVLRHYTNLDFSAESADLETIWSLAGDDNFYDKITQPIQDDLWEIQKTIYNKLRDKAGNREELAGRILNFLNQIATDKPSKVAQDLLNVLNRVDDLGLDQTEVLHILSGDEKE